MTQNSPLPAFATGAGSAASEEDLRQRLLDDKAMKHVLQHPKEILQPMMQLGYRPLSVLKMTSQQCRDVLSRSGKWPGSSNTGTAESLYAGSPPPHGRGGVHSTGSSSSPYYPTVSMVSGHFPYASQSQSSVACYPAMGTLPTTYVKDRYADSLLEMIEYKFSEWKSNEQWYQQSHHFMGHGIQSDYAIGHDRSNVLFNMSSLQHQIERLINDYSRMVAEASHEQIEMQGRAGVSPGPVQLMVWQQLDIQRSTALRRCLDIILAFPRPSSVVAAA